MILGGAQGPQSTGVGARVSALSVQTSEMRRTFRVHYTLWSAIWRNSSVLRKTGAHCLTVHLATLAVRPTG